MDRSTGAAIAPIELYETENQSIPFNPYHDWNKFSEISEKILNARDDVRNPSFKTLTGELNGNFYKKAYLDAYCHMATHVSYLEDPATGSLRKIRGGDDFYPVFVENGATSRPIEEAVKYTKSGSIYKRDPKKWTLITREDGSQLWRRGVYSSNMMQFCDDIQMLHATAHECRQVHVGLTRSRVDLEVADFDENFTEERWQGILNKLKELNIPIPSYVEIHFNGHYQVGWYFSKPIVKSKRYPIPHPLEDLEGTYVHRILYSTLARLLESDLNFTGHEVKNPYCSLQTREVRWLSDSCDPIDLINSLFPVYIQQIKDDPSRDRYDILYHKKNDETTSNVTSTGYRSNNPTYSVVAKAKDEESDGRHSFLVKTLRKQIWKTRRDTGAFPSYSEVMDLAFEIESSGCRNGSHSHSSWGIRDKAEIEQDAISILDWSIKHYREPKQGRGQTYLASMRYRSALAKKARRGLEGLKVYELRKIKGLRPIDIASKEGISDRSVRELCSINVEDHWKAIEDLESWLQSVDTTGSRNRVEEYRSIIKSGKRIHNRILKAI